jgi:crossover junction endodeoxyribonuclease RuvC
MSILGVDLSLRAPGFAVLDSETEALLITSQSLKSTGPERWQEIIENVKQIIDSYLIEFVVIEGYAFGAKFHKEDLAEIGGILRYFLFKRRIPFGTVPPATLKKFFTGDGRADKKKMMCEAFRRGFKCNNDNESDAAALACFGLTKGLSELKRGWQPKKIKQSHLNL